jgi:hypothetical protein
MGLQPILRGGDAAFARAGISSVLLLLIATAGCVNSQPIDEATFLEPVVLEPAVRESLPALLGDARPKAPLRAIVSSEKHEPSWNFGVADAQTQSALALDDMGLWQVIATTTMKKGGSAISAQLNLCGLVSMLTTADSQRPTSLSTAGPVGHGFFLLFMQIDEKSGARIRVKNFTTTAKHICMPEPGESFSYHYEREMRLKSSNPFLGRRVITVVHDFSCRVGTELQPASQFAEPFHGDALAVSCDHTYGSTVVKQDLAFLRDSQFYMLLHEARSWETVTIQYDAVDYYP